MFYCRSDDEKRINLSDDAYKSCTADGVCGGWKFVYSGCLATDSECSGRSGAWLPVTSVCIQGLYAQIAPMAPDGSSSSSSSSSSGSSPFSSSSSSSSSEIQTSSSSSEIGVFLLTELGDFITTEDGDKIALDDSSSTSIVGIMGVQRKKTLRNGIFSGIAKSISDLIG